MENPVDGGSWRAAGHGVAESWTGLRDSTTGTPGAGTECEGGEFRARSLVVLSPERLLSAQLSLLRADD